MAYQQQPGGMGNGGTPGGVNEQQAPQGTEYTLQGVMRFLQIEWHNHERARNSWDIERAEMKAKIAKQEGELRHGKRLNEQLEKQIRMLEAALKNERNKSRTKSATESQDQTAQQGPKTNGLAVPQDASQKSTRPPYLKHNSFLDTMDPQEASAEDREQYRDKSRRYLEKCMQEIQYLLAPPSHPPPPQLQMQNGPVTGLPDAPVPADDMYMRQRLRGQPPPAPVSSQQAPQPDHQQPPHVPRGAESLSSARTAFDALIAHDLAQLQQNPEPTATAEKQYSQPVPTYQEPPEDQVERITHKYDEYGRRLPERDEQRAVRDAPRDDSDGWNFGDSQAQQEPTFNDGPQPRRPDTDLFPSAINLPAKSPPRAGPGSHRRKSSGSGSLNRRRSAGSDMHDSGADVAAKPDPSSFKVKFALRGHLDVVRSVIFTGGGSPSEPEICSAGDDGTIKRWIIPASYSNIPHTSSLNDLDITCYFTHRGHDGIITSLAASPSTSFSTGGRASGDGWIFSGGQDATIRVWERGRVDPKATLDGHTDAIWTVAVLPGTTGSVFGAQSSNYGGPDRILLASGSADGTVRIWAVSAPPQSGAPQSTSRRGVGGSRRHSVTSGSNHPSSPQPNVATNTPFHYTSVHIIERPAGSNASPTCIYPLSPNGETFVVSYTDSCILIFDTRSGEELIGMASNETYDGTSATSINSVVATSSANFAAESSQSWSEMGEQEDAVGAGPTGSARGVEGVIVSGHEDRYIRFFDANSGQCTYTMLAHPSAISSLSLSQDGHEAVSAGHDASIRFWSLDKRICTQDITSHRPMRGEGVCSVVWSQDGRYVVSAGGDGVVKVFAR